LAEILCNAGLIKDGHHPLLAPRWKNKVSKLQPDVSFKPADFAHNRRLNATRLLLVGPDPSAIQDDPEGKEVINKLCRDYKKLSPQDQENVVLLTLPMKSRRQNHLTINAIQRCSTVVVQNSLQEGFGLTATEAMWKKIPVLGASSHGLRLQIRDGIDGRLTMNPKDTQEIATTLDQMLAHPVSLERWGRSAQRRVYDHFLIFSQVKDWIKCLNSVVQIA
jgi:trehalose synthase